MRWEAAPDVKELIHSLVYALGFDHVIADRVIALRSFGSKSDAVARIWELPRVWQIALGLEPHYVIEVVARRYDPLSLEEKEKTIIHELLHVPKTFSGALVPHRCFGKKRVSDSLVDKLHRKYCEAVGR